MTAKMATEAGFRRSGHSSDEGGARVTTLSALASDIVPPPVKTPRYNGNTDWEVFHVQFELITQASRCSTEVKTFQLAPL